MLVSSKRCCLASEPQIAREQLNTMPDGNLGPLTAAACSGGQSRAGSKSRRTKTDSLCSKRRWCG